MDSMNTLSRSIINREVENLVGLQRKKQVARVVKEDRHLEIAKYIQGRPVYLEELDRVEEVLDGLIDYTHMKL
jgi:RIO-like serine/threonine protein kinase